MILGEATGDEEEPNNPPLSGSAAAAASISAALLQNSAADASQSAKVAAKPGVSHSIPPRATTSPAKYPAKWPARLAFGISTLVARMSSSGEKSVGSFSKPSRRKEAPAPASAASRLIQPKSTAEYPTARVDSALATPNLRAATKSPPTKSAPESVSSCALVHRKAVNFPPPPPPPPRASQDGASCHSATRLSAKWPASKCTSCATAAVQGLRASTTEASEAESLGSSGPRLSSLRILAKTEVRRVATRREPLRAEREARREASGSGSGSFFFFCLEIQFASFLFIDLFSPR